MKKKWVLSCGTIALAAGLTFAFAACNSGNAVKSAVEAIEGEEVADAAAWEQAFADLTPSENANYAAEIQMNMTEEDQETAFSLSVTADAAVDGTLLSYRADYSFDMDVPQEIIDMTFGDAPTKGAYELIMDTASGVTYYKDANGAWTTEDPLEGTWAADMLLTCMIYAYGSTFNLGFDEVTYDAAQKGYVHTALEEEGDFIFKIEDGKLTGASGAVDWSSEGSVKLQDVGVLFTRGGQDLTMPTVTA